MRFSLLASMICLAATFTGAAQERGGDTTRTLEPAYSVYSRNAVSRDEIPAERIRAVSQIADALRLFSGVMVKDYGGVGGLKTINVRSLGSEHTGVFIDGLQVENVQNSQVDLGRFSTDDISSIRIFNGQQDGRIQSAKEYSAANAVYLESAAPLFSGGRKMTMSMRLRGGSFGTLSPALKAERRLGARTSARLSGEFLRTDGIYRFTEYDSSMVRQNSDLTSFRAQGQIFHEGSSKWNAKACWYDSERGLPGPVVRRPNSAVSSLDRQTDRDFFVQGNWSASKALSRGWTTDFLAKAKYAGNSTRYVTNPSEDPQAMPTDNQYTQQNCYLSYSQMFSHRRGFSVDVAQDFQYSCLDANVTDFVHPKRYSSWTALAGRFSRKGLSVSASLVGNIIFDTFREGSSAGGFGKSDKTRSFLVPAVLASYTFGKHFTASGFLKRSCRMPSFNELYYSLVGNSNLEPEIAWQYDIGAGRFDNLFGWLSSASKVELYHNLVTDKIVAVPTVNQFRWSMYNIGKAGIWGADLKWALGGRWGKNSPLTADLTFRWSFQRATDLSSPGTSSYKGQIPYIPRHSGSVSADVSWKGWRTDVSWLATGKRWSSSANLSLFEIAPWSTIDIWFSKTFDGPLSGITLRLALNNILNEQYVIVIGYPMPGFNALATVECSF